MRTITAALLAVAAGHVAIAQDFKAPITLKTTAMSVGDVVAKLKAATHADLRVTQQLAKEVVLIDVNGVPATDLMAKLAMALGGEWGKSDSTYQLLVRDTTYKKAISARIARDTEKVKKGVAKFIEQAKPDAPFEPPKGGPQIESGPGATQVFISGGSGTSADKPLAKILQMISPATIASIAPGARVVFSNMPFGVQLTLPGSADGQIRRAIADELKAAMTGNAGRSQVIIGPDKVDRSIERLRRGVYSRAYVAIRRTGWNAQFMVTFTVIDPDGMRLVGGSTILSEDGQPTFSFNGGDVTFTAASPDGAFTPPAQPQAEGKVIELSEKAKALARIVPVAQTVSFEANIVLVATSDDSGGLATTSFGSSPEVAGAAAGIIRDPVANDPLSFFVGESIRQTVPEDKPVVALLSDELFNQLRSVLARDDVKESTVKKVLLDHGYEYKEADGWLIVAPVDVDRCRFHRIDRKAFKSLLDSAQALGAAPLAAVAQYATVSPDTSQSLWDQTYASALYGSAMGSEVQDTRGPARNALRIYASMSEGERRANGRTTPINALGSAAARNELADLIFRSNDGPRPIGKTPQPENLAIAMTSSFGNPDMPDISSLFGPAFERTDIFSGVPPQTVLGMDGRDDVVLRVYDTKTGQSRIMSPTEVGSTRAMGEQPWGQGLGKGVDEGKKVQILSKRRVDMTLTFGGRYSMKRTLSDYAAVPESKLVSWGDLPLEIQDKITKAYTQSLESYKGSQIAFGQPSVKPPLR